MPSKESKQANLAKQSAMIEEGKRKHAQMEANIMSEAGEKFQRRFFDMTPTERLSMGLRMRPGGFRHGKAYKFEKKPSYVSGCCKRRARLRKSIYGSKGREDIFQCETCFRDCEVTIRPPRKKK